MSLVNEELRAEAKHVVMEALSIETGGVGPGPQETTAQYLSRAADSIVRHLDLADLLVRGEKEGPKRPAAKPAAKKAPKPRRG